MTISRDAILKKGGSAKNPQSLRGDLRKMVGSNTHGSMDNEPSYKKLYARSHQIRVGEPRKLRKSEVDYESPYDSRSLHDNHGHSSHNEPHLGYHENRTGMKRGGHAMGGEPEVTARRGGRIPRRGPGGMLGTGLGTLAGGILGNIAGSYFDNKQGLYAEGGETEKAKRGGHMRRRAEGGETEAKRRGGRCRAEGGETEAKHRGGRIPRRGIGGLLGGIGGTFLGGPMGGLVGSGLGSAVGNMLGLKKGGRARCHAEGGEPETARRGGRIRHAEGGETEAARRGGRIRRRADGGDTSADGDTVTARRGGHLRRRAEGGGTDLRADLLRRGGRCRAEGGEPETARRGGRIRRAEGGDMPAAAHGMWIQKAVSKHPGKLHRELGVPQGVKIPAKKLMRAEHSRNPTLRREASLAKTLRGFHPKGRSR